MYSFVSRLRSTTSQAEQLFLTSRVNPSCVTSSSFNTFSLRERKNVHPFHSQQVFNSSVFARKNNSSILDYRTVPCSFLDLRSVTTLINSKNSPTSNSLSPSDFVDIHSPSDFTRVHSFHTSASDGDQGGGKKPAKPGIAVKFKKMFKDYWYVLVPVHVATSIVWYGSFYMMCKSGIDMVAVLESLGTSEKILNPLRNSDAGYYALAYACYKIATPFRYTVTVGGTGYSIKYLSKKGILKAGDVKESAMEKASDLKENYEDFKEKAIDAKESAMEKATDFKEKAIDVKDNAMEKASDLKENYEEAKEKWNLGRDEARDRLSKFKNKLTIKYKNK